MKDIDLGELIRSKLKEQERSGAWLARQTGCTPAIVNKMLLKSDFSTKRLWSFSLAMSTDFFLSFSNHFRKAMATCDTKEAEAEKGMHLGELIKSKLKEQQRSAVWLAKQVNCLPPNVNSIFKRADLNTGLLWDISIALGVDLFAYRSAALHKEMTMRNL